MIVIQYVPHYFFSLNKVSYFHPKTVTLGLQTQQTETLQCTVDTVYFTLFYHTFHSYSSM
jgi:hypothetical protein